MRHFESKVSVDELDDLSSGELAVALAVEAPGLSLTLDAVKEAYDQVDLTRIKAAILKGIKVKIWQEGDLVNGVDLRQHPNPTQRERIVSNLDAGGNIYFVFIDGRLVYNQWHIRNEGLSPIPDARLQEVIDDHIKDIAQGLCNSALRRQVLRKL